MNHPAFLRSLENGVEVYLLANLFSTIVGLKNPARQHMVAEIWLDESSKTKTNLNMS